MEEDGGGVDHHWLPGIQGEVSSVQLKLHGIQKQTVGQASPDIARVRTGRLQLNSELKEKQTH